MIDLWFYETAVRLHRQGEGAPYTGLKPAGLDEGPVIPMADQSIETEDANEVIQLLTDALKKELTKRFAKAMSKKKYDVDDVIAGREYVQAMLGFVLYSHHLYECMKGSSAHGEVEPHQQEEEQKKHSAEIMGKAAKLGHSHSIKKEIAA